MGLDDAKRAVDVLMEQDPDESDRDFVDRKMEEHVGTSEVPEAHRRYEVLWEWRDE